MKNFNWILVCLALAAPAYGQELLGLDQGSLAQVSEVIPEFHEVTPTLWRGGRPGPEGLEILAKMGVKTDLNIDNDDESNEEEEIVAKQLGLHYISVPLSGFFTPSDEDVDAILSAINDKTNGRIFVHCKHGQDRTGMIVGLYRVFYQKWTPQAAYDEMLQYGFHPELFLLNRYFKKRSGLDD